MDLDEPDKHTEWKSTQTNAFQREVTETQLGVEAWLLFLMMTHTCVVILGGFSNLSGPHLYHLLTRGLSPQGPSDGLCGVGPGEELPHADVSGRIEQKDARTDSYTDLSPSK